MLLVNYSKTLFVEMSHVQRSDIPCQQYRYNQKSSHLGLLCTVLCFVIYANFYPIICNSQPMIIWCGALLEPRKCSPVLKPSYFFFFIFNPRTEWYQSDFVLNGFALMPSATGYNTIMIQSDSVISVLVGHVPSKASVSDYTKDVDDGYPVAPRQ